MVTRPGIKVELKGAMTALVTPFRNGEIDWPVVDDLVDFQIESGIDWIVPCGTTGESPTLSSTEQEQLLERVIERVKLRQSIDQANETPRKNRCRVLAGTGSNNTAQTIEKTKKAKQLGADAAMLVAPYYNRPPQEGLFRHYAAVAEAADLPLVLYNVPARTGVNIANDTVVRLRERFRNIVAIKDASGSVDNVTELTGRCGIAVLCGDDALTWPMMSLDAIGVISVIGNLVPGLMRSLVDAAVAGDVNRARSHHGTVAKLAGGLSAFGPNPIPIKSAMSLQGWMTDEFRLPLCPLDKKAKEAALTEREKEVLNLLLKGKSNKDISGITHISTDTVKTHLQNIYRKFGVKSRLEAVSLFLKEED